MSTLSPQDVTQKLQAWSEGDKDALAELLPIVYDELLLTDGSIPPGSPFLPRKLETQAFGRG